MDTCEWKIYYEGRKTYSNLDGPPELAPKRRVQVIGVAEYATGQRIERENDYYVWAPERGGWRGCDQFGLYDYLIDPGFKIVLFGKMLSNDEYKEIFQMAVNDPDLPKRSAYLKEERRPS